MAAVITPPDRGRGRGRDVHTSPIAELAESGGVPLLRPATSKGPSFCSDLASHKPGVLVVASYGEILREEVLGLAPCGSLNVHASLLPRWRGAAPIQRAILAGDAETGVCVQRMVLALDEGDVLLERRTAIGPEETGGALLARLAELGGEAIVTALNELEAGVAAFTPQDPGAVTYARKLVKADGKIDWSQPAHCLARQVRALHPWPGTRTDLPDGRSLVITEACAEAGAGAPGSVLPGPGLLVAAGEGALRLIRIKPAGKAEMGAAAFLNGTPLEAGEMLP